MNESTESPTDLMTTAAAAAATAALTAFRAPSARAADAAPIRIGLVGCGGRGTGAAENCLSAAPNIELVALADMFQDRLDRCRGALTTDREAGPLPGARIKDDHCFVGFDAYKRLIALPDVDLVLLATPPGFRPIHFEHAIDAGKHVFMEKPVAVDPVGVRRVIAAGDKAKEKKLAVVAGTVYRHQKSFIETIKQVHDGAIGDVVTAYAYYNTGSVGNLHKNGDRAGLTDIEYQIRNWYFYDWLSGDHIVEQHIHTIDVTDWTLRARPVRAVGLGGRQARVDAVYGNIFDHFSIDYEYPNGVRVTSLCRQIPGTDGYVGAQIVGTKGRAWIYEAVIKDVNNKEVIWKSPAAPNIRTAFVQEHTDLIESIRSGQPLNEARQIAESTLTAILGRECAYTGKKLAWDDLMKSDLDLSPPKYEPGPLPVRPVRVPGKEA